MRDLLEPVPRPAGRALPAEAGQQTPVCVRRVMRPLLTRLAALASRVPPRTPPTLGGPQQRIPPHHNVNDGRKRLHGAGRERRLVRVALRRGCESPRQPSRLSQRRVPAGHLALPPCGPLLSIRSVRGLVCVPRSRLGGCPQAGACPGARGATRPARRRLGVALAPGEHAGWGR